MADTTAPPPWLRRTEVLDGALVALLGIPFLVVLPGSTAGGPGAGVASALLILVICASVPLRHRYPVTVALAGSLAYVLDIAVGHVNGALNTASIAFLTISVLIWAVLLGYRLGARRPWPAAVGGLVTMCVATQWDDLNPFPIMLAVGPFLVAGVVASRRTLTAALQERGHELVAERERYAAEAVRYERMRIARELHDVVAHCMSIVVIQASAAQRREQMAGTGRAQLFDDILDLVHQAEADMTGLTRLLAGPAAPALTVASLEALVARGRTDGAHVVLLVSGDPSLVEASVASVVVRLLQESITNALKHAPGAALDIALTVDEGAVRVEVRNAAAGSSAVPLQRHGGGNGLPGLRERVRAVAGTFHAGPTPAGGWLVGAEIPTAQAVSVATAPPMPAAVAAVDVLHS